MSKISVYVARAMSGRIKEEVVKEATLDKMILEYFGFEVLDPVTSEGVEATKDILQADKQQMDVFWKRDKEMIRKADVVFIMSPHLPSLGVIREYGYARYFLWKKTITVFPYKKVPPEGAVCHYEDDYVTDDIMSAIREAKRTHETWFKRTKWRLSLYNRCLLKAIFYHLQGWF